MSRIIRVFPRRTNATPTDGLAYYGPPDFWAQADEIHISVTFTWDVQRAEELARQWRKVAPVRIGGPGIGTRGEEFTPGRYLKPGYVITSRGCPNKCWFCSVPKRDGAVRELPITCGWNVLDDNLLACSESHIRAVFAMLATQKRKAEFTGGLEAKRLDEWHVDLLAELKPAQVFFAYDEEADYEPLLRAGRMLRHAGLNITSTGNVNHAYRCYCLVGWPKDTMDDADKRMRRAYAAGFLPMAMLWRDKQGRQPYEWRRFQKHWARPAAINAMCRTGVGARI